MLFIGCCVPDTVLVPLTDLVSFDSHNHPAKADIIISILQLWKLRLNDIFIVVKLINDGAQLNPGIADSKTCSFHCFLSSLIYYWPLVLLLLSSAYSS